MNHILQHFTQLPRKGIPVEQLTDRDKVALAIAAGVEVEVSTEKVGVSHMMTCTTKQPIGIADLGDGKYTVFVRAP